MNLIEFNNRSWLGLFLATGLGFLGRNASAGLSLDSVEVDGRLTTVQADSTEPLRLSSQARSLRFNFTEGDTNNQPMARLRYKLEGFENSWRDLLDEHGMKVYLQFWDNETLDLGQVVGGSSYYMTGETPGWRGSVEKSVFIQRRETSVAPGRSVVVKIAITSLGYRPAIGLVGMDAIRLRIEHPEQGGRADQYTWPMTEGIGLNEPMGIPAHWVRQGSLAEMAQLRIRPTPVPHPVLVLNDTSANRFAVWITDITTQVIPTHPGDQVTLEWQTAYSVGGCSPGLAEYPRLKPGHYRFRVATAAANGELTGTEVSLPVLVVEPVYHRWEFWLTLVLAAGGGASWLSLIMVRRRLRMRLAENERQHALERERARIARDLHDDIGAGLTEIAMQSAWVFRDYDLGPTTDGRRRIERIRQSASELARNVDEIVWAVNPANDTVDRFANYLTQSMEQLLDAANLRIRFDVPTTLPNTPLTGKVRHFLFQAAREALNNAVKHARAQTVQIGIRIDNGTLRITIEDDGCGFTPDQAGAAGTHEGLDSMRRRMEEIGGQFILTSRPGAGTKVEFIAPSQN